MGAGFCNGSIHLCLTRYSSVSGNDGVGHAILKLEKPARLVLASQRRHSPPLDPGLLVLRSAFLTAIVLLTKAVGEGGWTSDLGL